MSTNEGTADRIVRAVLGAAALVWAVMLGIGSMAGNSLAAVGGILLVTGAIGFCPLYRCSE
jgi:hypothetical protein